MAHSNKQVFSGIRSVKRDYSSNSLPSSSQESGPNLPSQQRHDTEKRLKEIQKALEEQNASSQRVLAMTAPAQSNHSKLSGTSQFSANGKRPSSSQEESAPKRRQLPTNWTPAVQKNLSSTSSLPSSQRTSKTQIFVKGAPNNKSAPKTPAISLSEEQMHILELVEEGQSVFYTGSAGTGKSVLLREIIKSLRKKYIKSADAVAITASTGIAACNIGGVTIHSFAGIGIGVENAEQLAVKVRKNKKAASRWLRTKVLIIDEVSMIDGVLFDKLARIGSILRNRLDPFGGIQVVVTGDFFQLPPVSKGPSGQVKFAFEGDLWCQAIKKTFNLTKVFRQKDPEFVDMLNEMRFGRLSEASIAKFKSLSRELHYDDGVAATELFPRREDVEHSNRAKIGGINNVEMQIYSAADGGTLFGTDQGSRLLSNFMAPAQITLKIGAQVMLIKNIDDTLVNGSMGTVVRFAEPDPDNSEYEDYRNSGKPTSKGSASSSSRADASLPRKKWPVVEFTCGRTVMMTPETWKVELPNGEAQVTRLQVPLILSWAMSIHKSQGQTLQRVKVNLAKVFEKGQAYVALSRATSLNGLQVLQFDPKKVSVHPKVVEWSKTLQTIS